MCEVGGVAAERVDVAGTEGEGVKDGALGLSAGVALAEEGGIEGVVVTEGVVPLGAGSTENIGA